MSFLCLSGVWKTYFLLPPVAVEVAKNMFSHMDQLALIYDIIHLREVVLHSGLVTQMGHKTDEGLISGYREQKSLFKSNRGVSVTFKWSIEIISWKKREVQSLDKQFQNVA